MFMDAPFSTVDNNKKIVAEMPISRNVLQYIMGDSYLGTINRNEK